MGDSKKTKEALVEEFETLRSRVAELEQIEAEHQKTEETLKESEERYRAMFQGAAEGIIVADSKTMQFKYANPAICGMLGYTEEELKQIGVRDIHPKEDLEYVISEFEAQARGEKTLAPSIPCLRKNGTIMYADIDTAKVFVDGRKCNVGFFTDITERKKTEDELLFKSTLLGAQSETSIDGILIVDGEGESILFNKRFGQMWNIPQKILDTRDDEKMLQYVLDQLKEPNRFLEKVTYLYAHKNEKSRDEIQFKDGKVFDRYSSPLIDSNGNHYGRIWYFSDITEHKRAEEALQESKERFRALTESTSDWVWEVDQSGIYTYASPKVKDLLGYEPEEIIGKTPFDFMLPNEAERVAELFKNIVESRKPFDGLQNTNIHKDGRLVVLETSGVPIFGEGGNLLGYRGIDRDITERKESEEALREEKKRAEGYLSIAGVMLAIINVDENITMINEKGREILGYEEGELIGRNWFDTLVPKKIRSKVKSVFHKLVAGSIEPVEYYENPLLTKDGEERIIAFHNTVIRASNGQIAGTLTSGEDVTERKKAEEELQKARNELEIRVEQRTADLERVNKELRNEIIERKRAEEKLLIYQKQLRSLASELSLSEERLRRRIATNVHDHVGQNLAISKIKIESLRESVSSSELAKGLEEIRDLIAQTIESTRSLTFELSPPVLYELGFEAAMEWLVRRTRQQYGLSTEFKGNGQTKLLDDNVRILLFQAVRELLVNVAKHAQAHNVTVSTRRVGNEIQVSVEDDGVGFDISQTHSHDYKTTGFGLFSIRERLGHIGGHLEIESELGLGTRVTLVAPINHKNEIGQEERE